MTTMDVIVQNFSGIVDLAQRWSKHRWPNSECVRFPKLETHIGKWLDFTTKTKNILLGLTLDGVNPFGDLSSCHFYMVSCYT
jgi:hypothetical protein